MSRVKLGDVAVEVRESTKQPEGMPIVGLEHLTPGDLQLSQWSEESENTFTFTLSVSPRANPVWPPQGLSEKSGCCPF